MSAEAEKLNFLWRKQPSTVDSSEFMSNTLLDLGFEMLGSDARTFEIRSEDLNNSDVKYFGLGVPGYRFSMRAIYFGFCQSGV